jgi:hypothetical protein
VTTKQQVNSTNQNTGGGGEPGGELEPPPRLQVCTASMRVGLLGYWNFAPAGATSILAGAPVGATETLTLARTSRTTGLALPVAGGWTTEPPQPGQGTGRDTFNGFGTATLSGGLSLANNGDALTIAARMYAHGGNVQGGSPAALPMQIFGLAGQYGAGLESGISLIVPDLSLAVGTLRVRQWTGSVAFHYDMTGAAVFLEPLLVVMTIERSGSFIVCTAFINGDAAGIPVSAAAPLIDLSRVTYGDAQFSDGSVSQGALWNRKLAASEIVGMAFDLGCVHGTQSPPPPIEPEEYPLLNNDGTSAVHPEWIVPLQHGHGAIASVRGIRHTRLTHERRRRRYGLRMRLGNAAEAVVLAETLRVTAHGAKWTRWRHPKDDPPGPVETAPRYVVVNARDGAMALARSGGGAIADFTLVLEDL